MTSQEYSRPSSSRIPIGHDELVELKLTGLLFWRPAHSNIRSAKYLLRIRHKRPMVMETRGYIELFPRDDFQGCGHGQ